MLKDKNYDDCKYAWPGGYTFVWHYQNNRETILICFNCHEKAKQNEDYVFIGQDIHWEGESLWCDDCGVEMESEYGIPE